MKVMYVGPADGGVVINLPGGVIFAPKGEPITVSPEDGKRLLEQDVFRKVPEKRHESHGELNDGN